MALVLWFAGLVGLIIAATVASGRGRATPGPNDVAGRGVIAIAAIAYVAVVAGAVWLWGGATAREGRADRLREGATVTVAINGVRVPFEKTITIGHGADAGVRVPGAGPAELARVELDGAGVAQVRASVATAVIAPVGAGQDPTVAAKARGCSAKTEASTYTLPRGTAVVVIECEEGKPTHALTVRRDRARAELVVSPLAWHGRFAAERRLLRAGDALRLGGADDAIPGLVTWDVVAPHGAAAMLAIPIDPSDCAAWSSDPRAPSIAVDQGCELVAGAFAITATPFVPDDTAVVNRAARAALAIGAPPLFLLFALVLAPRRGRRARSFGRALRLCVLGGGVTALLCWRLLWAYRIDMMREFGTRVIDNQVGAIAVGAALAGAAVLALDALEGRSVIRRAAAVIVAWAGWLVVGALVVGVTPPLTMTGVGVLGLSLIAALVPLMGELVARRRPPPEIVLAAIAIGAALARMGGARGALCKLGLAYATVLAGHAALRAMLMHDTTWARRARLTAMLVVAAGAVALLDAGVTLAIVGVGLSLAMLVAGHDAMYDASHAGKIGLLEREHARLLVVHGAATIALAIGVATCALVASDRSLIEHGALAVLHAPLVAAALFGLAAAVARSNRRSWAPWVAAALAALAAWGARDVMVQRATAGNGVAAHRVSAVVEPGYALLRDDRAFVASASAWREATLVSSSAGPDSDQISRWNGQGYFAARVRDPGVLHSIDNDYLPVLVARESGVGGLMKGVVLLLALVVGGAAIASIRLRHASRDHRARWLLAAVAGSLVVYQPLASLGVLPLTGISWPGLGIDSPADLWLFVIGAMWCFMGGDGAADDERVRRTPRLARARRVVLVALVLAGLAAVVIVARAGACAVMRAAADDKRIDTALHYASSIACVTPDQSGTIEEVVPITVGGAPTDDATTRFDRELQIAWATDRAALVAALDPHAANKTASSDEPAPDPSASPPHARTGDKQNRTKDKSPQTRDANGDANGSNGNPMAEPSNARTSKGNDASNKGTLNSGRDASSTNKPSKAGNDPSDRKTKGSLNSGTDSSKSSKSGDTSDRKSGSKSGKDASDRKASGKDSKPTKDADAKDGEDDTEPQQVGPTLAKILEFFQLESFTPDPATPKPALNCPARVRGWRLVRDGDACVATFDAGWPQFHLAIKPTLAGARASCSVELSDDALSSLRGVTHQPRARIRVVSTPIGVAVDDLGELVIGTRIVRLRAGAPTLELSGLAAGPHVASKVTVADVALEVRPKPRGVVLRGPAELFVAEGGDPAAWRRTEHASEIVLDHVTLIAAGPPERRVVVLYRPPRAWAGASPVVDSLLADTAGDRTRRIYPYGSAMPELGWVNPYDVDRSLGLDGWIHSALAHNSAKPIACGTLEPPAIARDRVCTPSPLDGVMECRVMLQPQLVLTLRALADKVLAEPEHYTGRGVSPVRVAYVALRGDTGELIAQGNVVPGRPPLAYAPIDAAAEETLARLRNTPGEADAERVEWNLPIAVGSTFKPIVARAAEQAFPKQTALLTLTAGGSATGCRARRGVHVDPILGHCPPTSVAGAPTTADLHDFLQRSPNWYMAALGILGLALPDGQLAVKDDRVTFTDVIGSDLLSWPADKPLIISDATGPILGKRGLSIDGMRRTALWKRIEALLGRPICTLGDRGRCERAAMRADVCAARALPITAPGADLRNLVALGPDRIDPYADDRAGQSAVPVREYLQLLRGAGVHPIGSLVQLTDAFGRVIFDPSTGAPHLAASWFPAPSVGKLPEWTCKAGTGHATTVLGADGGLCAVVQTGGTANTPLAALLADPNIIVYGAKTGTIDSLADIARSPTGCRRWNESHVAAAKLECGKAPLDDSLFVIAFGVVTPHGTIPITLGIQLQRGGKSAAVKATPAFVHAIADYLRGP